MISKTAIQPLRIGKSVRQYLTSSSAVRTFSNISSEIPRVPRGQAVYTQFSLLLSPAPLRRQATEGLGVPLSTCSSAAYYSKFSTEVFHIQLDTEQCQALTYLKRPDFPSEKPWEWGKGIFQ